MFSWSGSLVAKDLSSAKTTTQYLQNIENQNAIQYKGIVNTAGAYIPSMCYSKTKSPQAHTRNPCYVCHTQGVEPNFVNDSNLQQQLSFPAQMLTNPYRNLFADRSKIVNKISHKDILTYVRQSNYLKNQQPILASALPSDWPGYRADAYYNFDAEGFDHANNGEYTLWRAFRYYPFPGAFWPTNGSSDDVLIRLDKIFAQTRSKQLDIPTYKINLAIVESLIKSKNIDLASAVDEKLYGEDLNKNGKLDLSLKIVFPPQHYVGLAAVLQQKSLLHLAPGLYPEQTEFLHSVRYLDLDNNNNIILSARMKELRYARKYRWLNYAELRNIADADFWELEKADSTAPQLDVFRGQIETGLRTKNGWVFQGFIEDKLGQLRPQTHEETLYCMGCHSAIGATTDATFSFPRKLTGLATNFGWQHWTQKGLQSIKEKRINYKNHPEQYEYSFYLENNPSGNEFANNSEVNKLFFNTDGSIKQNMLDKLHQDISLLLLPTAKRALTLDKGYKVIVEKQSFIYGREGNVLPMKNVLEKVKPAATTGITTIISR